MSESPLSTTNPLSLEELFSRDPLDLSDADVEAICLAFRRQRERWVNEERSAKAQGRRANPAAANLSLGDLEL